MASGPWPSRQDEAGCHRVALRPKHSPRAYSMRAAHHAEPIQPIRSGPAKVALPGSRVSSQRARACFDSHCSAGKEAGQTSGNGHDGRQRRISVRPRSGVGRIGFFECLPQGAEVLVSGANLRLALGKTDIFWG